MNISSRGVNKSSSLGCLISWNRLSSTECLHGWWCGGTLRQSRWTVYIHKSKFEFIYRHSLFLFPNVEFESLISSEEGSKWSIILGLVWFPYTIMLNEHMGAHAQVRMNKNCCLFMTGIYHSVAKCDFKSCTSCLGKTSPGVGLKNSPDSQKDFLYTSSAVITPTSSMKTA